MYEAALGEEHRGKEKDKREPGDRALCDRVHDGDKKDISRDKRLSYLTCTGDAGAFFRRRLRKYDDLLQEPVMMLVNAMRLVYRDETQNRKILRRLHGFFLSPVLFTQENKLRK